MKYTTEIKINAPVEKVAKLLSDHSQLKNWIKEIESYEPVSGKPATVNAKTKLVVNVRAASMIISETILAVEFPKRFTVLYEMKGGSLLADSHLKAIGKDTTLYTLNHEFKFSGVLKLATALMKPAFIKHSERMMEDFKKLAEK